VTDQVKLPPPRGATGAVTGVADLLGGGPRRELDMVTRCGDPLRVNRDRLARLIPYPWVGWRYVPAPGRAKPANMPINPRTGRPASVTDPRTWGDCPAAVEAVERYKLDGVGVVLTPEAGLTGIDLDSCRDPATAGLDGWADEVLARLPDTYAEASPSGRGVRPSSGACRRRVAGSGSARLRPTARVDT
jgi:hypothetical protein